MAYYRVNHPLGLNANNYEKSQSAASDEHMPQRDDSPVEQALDTLCKVLDSAMEEVDEMRARLAPVSSTRPTEERETGQNIPSGCMLEARIEGITNSVNKIATDLSEMRAALRI